MTGSILVPILVPIVALVALGVWLALVYYADAHPQNAPARVGPADAAGPLTARGAGATGPAVPAAASGQPGEPGGPGRGDVPAPRPGDALAPEPAQPGRHAS